MPDPTPTAAELKSALFGIGDHIDQIGCEECAKRMGTVRRALAEQPRAVFSEAVVRAANEHAGRPLSEVTATERDAGIMARTILDAAEGERVAGEEGGDAGNGTDGLQEPPATPDPPPSTPAPPESDELEALLAEGRKLGDEARAAFDRLLNVSPTDLSLVLRSCRPKPPEGGVDTAALRKKADEWEHSGWNPYTEHLLRAAAAELDALRLKAAEHTELVDMVLFMEKELRELSAEIGAAAAESDRLHDLVQPHASNVIVATTEEESLRVCIDQWRERAQRQQDKCDALRERERKLRDALGEVQSEAVQPYENEPLPEIRLVRIDEIVRAALNASEESEG